MCHNAQVFEEHPGHVPELIIKNAQAMYQQAVVARVMPDGQLNPDDGQWCDKSLGAWVQAQARNPEWRLRFPAGNSTALEALYRIWASLSTMAGLQFRLCHVLWLLAQPGRAYYAEKAAARSGCASAPRRRSLRMLG